jgi:hypothetical protein
MKMYFGTFDLGEVEVELEDILEELPDLPPASEVEDGKAFMGLENDKHSILNFTRIADDNWAVVAGDTEKAGFSLDEVKKIIEDFFNGKAPEWAENVERVDFPDGIDDILDGDW